VKHIRHATSPAGDRPRGRDRWTIMGLFRSGGPIRKSAIRSRFVGGGQTDIEPRDRADPPGVSPDVVLLGRAPAPAGGGQAVGHGDEGHAPAKCVFSPCSCFRCGPQDVIGPSSGAGARGLRDEGTISGAELVDAVAPGSRPVDVVFSPPAGRVRPLNAFRRPPRGPPRARPVPSIPS